MVNSLGVGHQNEVLRRGTPATAIFDDHVQSLKIDQFACYGRIFGNGPAGKRNGTAVGSRPVDERGGITAANSDKSAVQKEVKIAHVNG